MSGPRSVARLKLYVEHSGRMWPLHSINTILGLLTAGAAELRQSVHHGLGRWRLGRKSRTTAIHHQAVRL